MPETTITTTQAHKTIWLSYIDGKFEDGAQQQLINQLRPTSILGLRSKEQELTRGLKPPFPLILSFWGNGLIQLKFTQHIISLHVIDHYH
jgi:hypothetical protein